MDVSDVAISLLTKGVVSGKYSGMLSSLNELLRSIQYEAILWPDMSCILLKDNYGTHKPACSANKVKEAIMKITLRMLISRDAVDILIMNGLAEDTGSEFTLSKRALVQYPDFISSLNGRYVPCKICGFLCDDYDMHSYCKTIMDTKLLDG